MEDDDLSSWRMVTHLSTRRVSEPSASDSEKELELDPLEDRLYGERKLTAGSKSGVQLSNHNHNHLQKYVPSSSPNVVQKGTEVKQKEILDFVVARLSKRHEYAKKVTKVKLEPTESESKSKSVSKSLMMRNAFGNSEMRLGLWKKLYLRKVLESLKMWESGSPTQTLAPAEPTQAQLPATPTTQSQGAEVKQEEILDFGVGHVSKSHEYAKAVTKVKLEPMDSESESESVSTLLMTQKEAMVSRSETTPNAFGNSRMGLRLWKKRYLRKALESLKMEDSGSPTQSQPAAPSDIATTDKRPCYFQTYRSEDGKLQVRGLLLDLYCYRNPHLRTRVSKAIITSPPQPQTTQTVTPEPTVLQTELATAPSSTIQQASQQSQAPVQLSSSGLQSQLSPVKNLQFQNASPVQVQSPSPIQVGQLQRQISPAQLEGLRQIDAAQTAGQIKLLPGTNSTEVELVQSTQIQVSSVANTGQIQVEENNRIRQEQAPDQNTTARLVQNTPRLYTAHVSQGRTQFQLADPETAHQVLARLPGQVPQTPSLRPFIVRTLVTGAQLARLQQQGLIRTLPPVFVFQGGEQVLVRPSQAQELVLSQERIIRPNLHSLLLAPSGVAIHVVNAVQAPPTPPVMSPSKVPVRSPPPIVSAVKIRPAILTYPSNTSHAKVTVKTSPDTTEEPTVSSAFHEPREVARRRLAPVLSSNNQRRKTSHTTFTRNPALFNRKEDLKSDIVSKRVLIVENILQKCQKERDDVESSRKRKSSTHTETSLPKQDKPSCTCAAPITSTQVQVACAKCSQLFHGRCVKITRKMLNKGKVYTCKACKVPVPVPEEVAKRVRTRRKSGGWEKKEIFCLCKQPYDNTQFYIYCDKCQDWFHGRCVGVLPAEGDTILTYRCPTCHPTSEFNNANFKKLVAKDHAYLRTIMTTVLAMKESDEFYDPVDLNKYPDYTETIPELMELRTMEQRVNQEMYVRLVDFVADACRLFGNCRHYHPEKSVICDKADELETVLIRNLRIMRRKMMSAWD